MKLNLDVAEGEKEQIGDVEFVSRKAKISDKNMNYVLRVLAKQYAKPPAAIVREYASNIYDAYVPLKQQGKEVDEVAIVRLFIDDTGQHYLEFVDYGVGMNPQVMDDVFMSYGESTKRDSDDYIGQWGFGSKSAFSYTNFFYVITKTEGVESTYILVDSGKDIDYNCLLQQEITDGSTGTIIRVPIKPEDIPVFEKAIVSELKYFTNIYVANFANVVNDYKIHKFNTFQIREDSFRSNKEYQLHLTLGRVNYPIKFDEIDELPINFNAALIFDIGELCVTPNREELEYNQKTKDALKKKLTAFKEEIAALVLDPINFQCDLLSDFRNKSIKLQDYCQVNNVNLIPDYIFDIKLNNLNLSKDDCRYSILLNDGYYKLNHLELNPKKYTNILFNKTNYTLKKYNYTKAKVKLEIKPFEQNVGKYVIIDENQTLKVYEKRYLLNVVNVNKVITLNLSDFYKTHLKFFLKYNTVDRNELKVIAKDFINKYENEFLNTNFVFFKNLNIPENYGKTPRAARSSSGYVVEKGIISYMRCRYGDFNRSSQHFTTFEKNTDIFYIIGTNDNRMHLLNLFGAIGQNEKIEIMSVSRTNMKDLLTLSNVFDINDVVTKKENSDLFKESKIKKIINEILNCQLLMQQQNAHEYMYDVNDFYNHHLNESDSKNHLNLENVKTFNKLINYFIGNQILNENINTKQIDCMSEFLSEKFIKKTKLKKSDEKNNIFQQWSTFTKDFYLELHPHTSYSWGYEKTKKIIQSINDNLLVKQNKLNKYIKINNLN